MKYFTPGALRQMGISGSQLVSAITGESLRAAEIVKEEFESLLKQLKQNSISEKAEGSGKTFDGYTVEIRPVPSTLSVQGLGSITIMLHEVFVQAPAGVWNVFDQLDRGRPSLPRRKKPYTLWSLRSRTITSEKSVRSASTGRFTVVQDKEVVSNGNVRYNGVPLFRQGPIQGYPARKLYMRVLKNAIKKNKSLRVPMKLLLVEART